MARDMGPLRVPVLQVSDGLAVMGLVLRARLSRLAGLVSDVARDRSVCATRSIRGSSRRSCRGLVGRAGVDDDDPRRYATRSRSHLLASRHGLGFSKGLSLHRLMGSSGWSVAAREWEGRGVGPESAQPQEDGCRRADGEHTEGRGGDSVGPPGARRCRGDEPDRLDGGRKRSYGYPARRGRRRTSALRALEPVEPPGEFRDDDLEAEWVETTATYLALLHRAAL
jgi:hypothetical protein